MASATFEIDPGTGTYGTAGLEAIAAASATINCRVSDIAGVTSVEWSCHGTHAPAATAPTFALSGVPLGRIATFTLPAGAGQAYGITCKVNGGASSTSNASQTAKSAVRVNFSNGRPPVFIGETLEASATHGTVVRLNDVIDDTGGGAGAPTDAEYIVASANGSLTAERVATTTATIAVDNGTVAQTKWNLVADSVGNTHLRNSSALSVIGRSVDSAGDPADITTTNGSAAVLRESGGVLGFGTIATAALTDDSVSNAKLRNSGPLSVIGRSANSTGDPADISATAATDSVLRESGSVVGFGTIATAGVANDAITDAKLRNSGALSVVGRAANSSGDPADIAATPASDAVLRESGSTVGFGTIATGGLANNAVTDGKLRDSGALSVVGRSANSSGDPADISATPASDAVLRESGSVVGFGTVATAGIANAAVTNAKRANMAQATISGRAAGAGTGDPTDLTAAQVATILAGSLIGPVAAITATFTTTGTEIAWDIDTELNDIIRWDGAGGLNVQGIPAPTAGQNSRVAIINVTAAQTLTLEHQDGAATDVNRLLSNTGLDIAVLAAQRADIIYDFTTQRWRAYSI